MKNRVLGENAGISRLSKSTGMTSGTLSSVSATNKEATDENGEDHTYIKDAKTRPFVSSGKKPAVQRGVWSGNET